MNKLILKSTEVNSTSIIPNFGAIMKMGKTFMYNEFLKYDDGKLAKFISEEKGIDEAAAKEDIKSWVASLQNDLDAGKTVVFDGVGELVKADGKLKFTAKTGAASNVPVAEKTSEKSKEEKPVVKEKEEKKAESVKPVEEPKKEEKKKPKVVQSEDFKAKEVVDKIQEFTDKTELINFTRGDSRKTVVAALNDKLDELNGKKKAVTIEEPKTAEVKPPKNVVTEVKAEPKEETKKPIVEQPQKEEAKDIKPVVVPSKEEEKKVKPVVKEKSEPRKESIEKPVVEEKKEDVKPTIKEKAATIEKPKTDKKEEEEAIAAIVGGVEKTEKETKKRKKKWILWVSLLLILIGGGTVGYLKKDMIMGWFDKKHEPKELAENKEVEEVHSVDSDTSTEENNHSTKEVITPVDTAKAEEPDQVDNNSDIVTEPIIEEPIDEEPVVEEPVVNSSTEGNWHIVAGSYSSKENAENKVEKLKSMGYSSAKVLGKYNGLYTVRVSSFNSKDEAKSELESFKSSGNSGIIKKL